VEIYIKIDMSAMPGSVAAPPPCSEDVKWYEHAGQINWQIQVSGYARLESHYIWRHTAHGVSYAQKTLKLIVNQHVISREKAIRRTRPGTKPAFIDYMPVEVPLELALYQY
jgi:hypothetical protein